MAENKSSYSPRQLAEMLGVSVQSVQRWVDAGRLKAWKTPSGHRKIDVDSAQALIDAMRSGGGQPPARNAGTSPRVLVVDDDPAALALVEMLVQEQFPAAVVATARNGFEGLQAMGRMTPDILVTDIVMPHIDGLEMLRHVAAQDDRPALVIATSFLQQDEVERRGRLDGVSFLPKPLDADAFQAMLRRWQPRPD
ncbi:MAG: response regulator [Burkholderiaceae bacterium]|jgi:excisionase family DNA binding protein